MHFMLQPFVGSTPGETVLQLFDVAIVAYLVYRLLLIIRGTRGVALAVSFLFIWIVYMASPLLGLHTVHQLFHTLFSELSMFVIFALIIFQDEIRRAMAQVGRFRRPTPVLEAQAIEEVVQAAGALAKKRLGAIIAFEGSANLDEYTTEGTVVDATLTRETIFATFIPSFENPLHDGALIIRGLRVYKSGVLLPLTTRTDLAKSLGTRHRAAIGITEQTDTVVVVVSEERGSISACIEGNIMQDLDMANLRKLLLSRFRRTREAGTWSPMDWWRQRKKHEIAQRMTMLIEPPSGRHSMRPASSSVPPDPVVTIEDDHATRVKDEGEDLSDSKSFAEFLGNKS